MARIKTAIDSKAMEIFAAAVVQGHFDYVCISWYTNLPKNLKKKLQTSQNKLDWSSICTHILISYLVILEALNG